MPVVAEGSTVAEHIRLRRPRSQPIPDTDPNPQIPSIIQSTRCKSSISSLLLSTFSNTNANTNEGSNNTSGGRKKNFASAKFRGLGCAASSQVSVPAVIRTSADWQAKKVRKKKQRSLQQQQQKKSGNKGVNAVAPNPPAASVECVVPDVWCAPGIGFSADAASVDCVVARRPASGRGKVDGDKINQRERPSCPTRRATNSEHISFHDSDPTIGMMRPGSDVFGPRYYRHVRHRSPEGLAEIVLFESNFLMGGRSNGHDRYRDWRLDVDNMSYEELLELGDRIGYVSTGLQEDEIGRCLRKSKLSILDELSAHLPTELDWKCSICQEEYEADDEMGKLECGHGYHIDCIKQWLGQKNSCPVCKATAAAQC